jgi:hypothetical protein
VQSKAKSTVDPVIRATSATMSDERALIVCVAPNCLARSRRLSCRSTAMILVAPDAGRHDGGDAHGADAPR